MTFSKASRTSVLAALLCLLLMGFAGASYGAVRFSVGSSPTEVINTGMSEVTGSFNMNVMGEFNRTGSSAGGDAQIGIAYNAMGTHMTIDNTTSSGIRIFYSSNFGAALPPPQFATSDAVQNLTIANVCFGQITINIGDGANVYESAGDFVRLEGVRGRIATSTAVTQGADLYAALQSINDPAAYSFDESDAIYRVARSYPGMAVGVENDGTALLLCFPTLGVPPGTSPDFGNYIRISEGFARAFVDLDANNDGSYINDRVDTGLNQLGAPDNSTQVVVYLTDIPASVDAIHWFDSTTSTAGAYLRLVSTSFSGIDAAAIYSYEAINQVDTSDLRTESFDIMPIIELGANQTDTGVIQARAALYPFQSLLTCSSPANDSESPDFAEVWQSDNNQSNTYPGQNDPYQPYVSIIRCNCYMLFSYVASSYDTNVNTTDFDTGFAVANTSQDSQVFDDLGAPEQEGPITFYFYDSANGYIGNYVTPLVEAGETYVGLLSQMLAARSLPVNFKGYIIAKAEFQYCHGVSYIADSEFAASAQGYSALIIPDPAVKSRPFNRYRTPTAASDVFWLVPAGESLNN